MVIHYYKGGKTTLSPTDLKFLDQGKQGIVYAYEENGQKFALKCVEDPSGEYITRYKHFRSRLETHSTPTSVRSMLPVGQGRCQAKDFAPGLDNGNTYYTLLAFNFIQGDGLGVKFPNANKAYSPTVPDFTTRVNIARQFLEYKIFMEDCGVYKADGTPDNIMVTHSNELRSIDLCGGGIILRGKVRMGNKTLGKTIPICFPPELEFHRQYDLYTERWIGLGLLWHILTATKQSLPFLEKPSTNNLELVVNHNHKTSWVPDVPQGLENSKFGAMQTEDFINQVFKGAAPDISRLLYRNYIEGFSTPSLRPSFRDMLKAISQL